MTDQIPDLSALNAQYASALVGADLEGLLAMYDEDALMIGSGLVPVEGRAALGAYYAGVFGAGLTYAALTSARHRVVGGTIVDTGRYEMTIEPQGGDAMHDAGQYTHVLRLNSDGVWRIWHDMFTSDGAA